ncbi:galactosylceramide sulfotransferase isoform X2 [Strongylocentrotus purpuratus]|uniref:Galactosylceramide sulfotransferase-like n=1 Tax=Strongylocentrotus purpuratus TaxID=7668 RepID=A0A7M7PHQ8_STRPU|nr:galactosylceramide sulfotransferase isoform X2 [Strongylocentrotus purpuratus]XP_030851284.1 galactosylceramide sulfotransferase isoform X2 [Strongylocentrotus purpuratus]
MAKRAVVASTVVLGLMAVVILGLLCDGGYYSSDDVTVVMGGTEPQRPVIENDMDGIERISPRTRGECHPQKQIVFLKTHKTASSTTAGIIGLFAYKNNLTMAVPPEGQAYMDRTKLFQRDMIARLRKSALSWRDTVGFNVFSCHARYNRKEMAAIVPKAKYITILRDPCKQLPSALVYYKFDLRLERKFDRQGRTYSNVFEEFMDDPAGNMAIIESHTMAHVMHNQQFFDLGLDTKYSTDWVRIDKTIAKLDKELDLVMITEYYDESLILLRDLLCWTTQDILYTKRMVRNSTSSIQVRPEMRTKIRQWNGADTHLYEHYNRTLWQKIAAYGPRFNDELQKFRDRLKNVTEEETGSHRILMNKMAKRMKSTGIYA